ncbi:sensor histidine kinase [Paenibacillus sp. sgz500958]|uniref:sensor histidine kinase n=1 Tax=Paenibacillus sp. sgz500958 TaxID=3242475 RepID=UPI0036D233FA
MYDRRLFQVLILGFAAALAAGIFMGTLISLSVNRTSHNEYAKLIGAIYNKHPDMEAILIQGLHSSDANDMNSGSALLNRYGYTTDSYGKDTTSIMAASITVWVVLFALVATVFLGLHRRQKQRIDGLTGYLGAINLGKESVLPQAAEDALSLLEDELHKTVVELRQTRESALHARQSLADNLADIAHQLKTPLTSISMMTELLAESRQGVPEDAIYVERIQSRLQHFEHLIAALLMLSKLDAGILELRKDTVDVQEMLAEAVEPLKDIITERRQTLSVQGEPVVTFIGDPRWSAEAIRNLIKNCSEHTPAGGSVTLSFEQNPLYTKIVVEDNGEGLNPEDIPRLFERFFRGKNTRKDSVGIGLAFAKSIMEKQNGQIRAANRPEGGASFTVKIYAR